LDEIFAGLGYERPPETTGQLLSYQSHYGRRDRHGGVHAFDVHWKISNRQALPDPVGVEERGTRRNPHPALRPGGAPVDPAHALILALVHRAGHHPGSRELLWIYDLHLLAGGLTDAERQQAEDLARSRGLSRIACEGLALARDTFAAPTAARMVDTL